jgi:hypothetical protein
MTYDEMYTAISSAREVMTQAESFSRKGLEIAAGRLRHLCLSHEVLLMLKRELQGYNVHKRKWNS